MGILGQLLAPIIAEIVMRFVDKYVNDAVFRARLDSVLNDAKKLAQDPNRTKTQVAEAADALTQAINSR